MRTTSAPGGDPARAAWMKRYPLPAYFILAYAVTWVVAIPLGLSARGVLPVRLPLALHYLTAYGPMLAAIIVTWVTGGSAGSRDLLSRIVRWRVGGWFLVAALSPLWLFALAALALRIFGRPWPEIQLLGEVNFLPNIGLLGAFVLWILTSGIGEETGWRGFALPRLQRGRSALSASLILSVFWALWHLPFLLLPYQPNYANLGILLPGFVLGLAAGAIVSTWLYNSTSGSILMVTLWHGVLNYVTAAKAGEGVIAVIVSTAIGVWAVAVVVVFKPA